jgi:glycerol dehydrogenase-like iron-containing ADH family enzyme
MVANSTTLQDWLRAHRALMEAEQRFAALAMGFAAGTVSQQQLDHAHEELLALRMLCEAVFQKAVATLGRDG